jgi:hypothetical protein
VGNFFLTARGSWHKVRRSYALIFLLIGIWAMRPAPEQREHITVADTVKASV